MSSFDITTPGWISIDCPALVTHCRPGPLSPLNSYWFPAKAAKRICELIRFKCQLLVRRLIKYGFQQHSGSFVWNISRGVVAYRKHQACGNYERRRGTMCWQNAHNSPTNLNLSYISAELSNGPTDQYRLVVQVINECKFYAFIKPLVWLCVRSGGGGRQTRVGQASQTWSTRIPPKCHHTSDSVTIERRLAAVCV